MAPAYAIPKLYEQSGVKQQDVAMFEVNEAFSGVAIANMRLCNLDPAKTNVHGGAVSLGHPLGYVQAVMYWVQSQERVPSILILGGTNKEASDL